jgi:thiol-disulfide isomerase/thioredoxin
MRICLVIFSLLLPFLQVAGQDLIEKYVVDQQAKINALHFDFDKPDSGFVKLEGEQNNYGSGYERDSTAAIMYQLFNFSFDYLIKEYTTEKPMGADTMLFQKQTTLNGNSGYLVKLYYKKGDYYALNFIYSYKDYGTIKMIGAYPESEDRAMYPKMLKSFGTLRLKKEEEVNPLSFKQQYNKCSQIMNGVDIEDTSFFTLKYKMLDCLIGSKAPDFSAKALDGMMLTLANLRGQVVVINFWNTGCKPCIAEMPALNEIVQMYKGKNVTFISMAPEKDEELIRTFLKKRPFDFIPVANAKELIVEAFLTEQIYPYTMIIDKSGNVKKIIIGAAPEKEKTFKSILPHIDESLSKK